MKPLLQKKLTCCRPITLKRYYPLCRQFTKWHAPNNWKTVLEKTTATLFEMGNNNPLKPADYAGNHQPTLLMPVDRDKMVTLDETLEVYKSLTNAQLAILPNTSNPIELLNTNRLVYEIKTFLMKDL